ncbi:MAG TPA: hypothetical protein VH107_18995, partial [Lacipirellulaceae bacterium]|nr:hypothetical protein [Lacipirellulaceae bacterium]
WLRSALPEHHLSSDTKDSVKVAMGLVATMVALVLGLLIAAAKDKYDRESAGVTQLAAKVIYFDRMLANYGPEASDVREQLRKMVEMVRSRMWPDRSQSAAQLDPTASRTESVFVALQNLAPKNDLQTTLKSHAISSAFDLGQMRWQEFEQAQSTVSIPLLCILTFWLAILFVSFGMFAPSNSTVVIALAMAALAVAGGVFLMMELNSPFSGILQISSAPFDDALAHLGK